MNTPRNANHGYSRFDVYRNTKMDPTARRQAFTLAEVLIALIITALLMAALAAVVHGGLTSYRENEDLATVSQTARAALTRITRDIRTAEAMEYDNELFTIIPPNDGSGITEIQYERDGGELIYRVTKSGHEATESIIASTDDVQISSFSVTEQTGQDWQGYDCTKCLAIGITLTIEGKTHSFSATARPRRNHVY